jgi:phosphopantetheinyl transferase/acyl carrier protein
MLAHLQLMEKFLETQEAVMRQFLAGSALTAGDTKRPIAQASPASAHTAPMAGPPPKEPVISPSTQVTQESLAADLAVKASEDSVAPARPELDQKVSSRHGALDVKAVLLRLVSEKTGYPEEVLDLEANLEADLGIDSIKRVEILSTFGRETGLLNLKDMDRVSSLKTLGEMIGFFVQRSAAGHKVESKGEGLAPTQPTATFPRPTEEEGKGLPFIREVRVHIPGQELEAWCTLSLDEDRFLHDHTLGREISQLDASLLALPVVPLTMSMEILAEAAAYLMPGQALIGMRHVRAYRWILLENESIPLVVVARRKPASNEVEVRLQEADSEGVVQPTPILEGTMVFASARPAPEPAPPFMLRGGRPSRWLPSQLYTRGMFHGPAFQAVVSIDQWGEDGAVATLRVPSFDRFLRSHQAPAFIAEPVILDAAGQLIGFWTMEHLETGFVVFPYRLEALDFYGPPLTPFEEVSCRARSVLMDGGRVRSDIEIVDCADQVRMRLVGWEDRRFNLSRQFYDFTLNPGAVRLSEPWKTPLGRFDGDGRYHCRRIGSFAEGFFEAHYGFWEKVLAYLVLNRAERRVWQGMTGPKRRRVEWLLGRVAAKEAVTTLIQERFGLALCPADVEIGNDERGRPVVRGVWLSALRGNESSIAVSISHAAGMAVAIAGLIEPGGPIGGIGVDVEPVHRRDQGFAELAFSSAEQRLLADLDGDGEEAWALRLWCAKEAAGKALGYGLVDGPQGIVVRRVDPHTGIVQVGLSGEMAHRFPAMNGHEITAFTAREGELVVASVVGGG